MRKVLHDCAQQDKQLITSESGEMRNLYILNEDGSREPLSSQVKTDFGNIDSNRGQNCFNPKFVRELIHTHNYSVTETFMRKLVIAWVENQIHPAYNGESKGVTTYWGELVTITQNADEFEVNFKDPYYKVERTLNYKSEDELNYWLERNYSPYYSKVKDWELKYVNDRNSAWSILKEYRQYSSTSCVPPRK